MEVSRNTDTLMMYRWMDGMNGKGVETDDSLCLKKASLQAGAPWEGSSRRC